MQLLLRVMYCWDSIITVQYLRMKKNTYLPIFQAQEKTEGPFLQVLPLLHVALKKQLNLSGLQYVFYYQDHSAFFRNIHTLPGSSCCCRQLALVHTDILIPAENMLT